MGTSQFAELSTQQKLGTDLGQSIQQDNRRDNCRDQRGDDDSSTRHASMGELRERHVAVRNRVELQERQQVELRQRANLLEPPKPPSDLQKENRYCKKNQNQERQRSERSYRQDRHYRGSYARGGNEQPGRSSDEKPGDKRKYMKIQEPMSPEGMLKAARKVKDECPEVLERYFEEQKLFEWKNGERHLYAESSFYCPNFTN